MTKPPTLHRWALLDKAGVTRHTIEATTRPYAIQEACKRLKRGIRSGLPKGWGLKKLEPVGLVPTPEPRAFKVGDEVKIKTGHPYDFDGRYGQEERGTITKLRLRGCRGPIECLCPNGQELAFKPEELELLSPAPQPKAEEGKPEAPANVLQRYVDVLRETNTAKNAEIATLKAELEKAKHRAEHEEQACIEVIEERDEAEEALGEAVALVTGHYPEWSNCYGKKDALADIDESMASLKAEVERLVRERDDAREEMTENYKNYRAADDRAEAAEAKLDDIKALFRSNVIMSAMPGEPTFGEAIQFVLDRR